MKRVLPQAVFRRMYGAAVLGYVPNYRQPRTFNEKLVAWYTASRDQRIVDRADKLGARSYVSAVAPWVCLSELFAVGEDAERFPFDELPDKFVLKASHGWKQTKVLSRPFDVAAARELGAAWLRQRHGDSDWEWHYLKLPPRLYAESYLGTADGEAPIDYKVFVIGGKAQFIQVFVNRDTRVRRLQFDRSWQHMNVFKPKVLGGEADVVERHLWPSRPSCLDEMLAAAEALGSDVPFVRADFYVVQGRLYFGELTFLPAAGYVQFHPVTFDRWLGDQFLTSR